MSKIVYSGIESSGKSLKLAMVAGELVERNAAWKKQSNVTRSIYSNEIFTKDFEFYASEKGVPILYWSRLDELVKVKEADVIIDEVGNYFDSRSWQDLSIDVRRWLSQGAKMGIEIYGAAQDFAQVDLAFRRLVNELWHISKIIGSPRPSATRPPVKRIWGLCMMRALDPQGYKENEKKFSSEFSLPRFFLIQRKYCEIFDTGQFLKRGGYPPLRHVERVCENENCSFHKILHV